MHSSPTPRSHRRLRTITGLLVAASCLGVAACGSDTPTASNETAATADAGGADAAELESLDVSEVIRSVFYAPLYVAIEAGLFEQAGLDVDLTTANGSDKVAAAVLGGRADVGLLGPEAVVYIHNQDSNDDLVILSQLTQRDGSFLVAREPNDAFDLDALDGTKVLGWRPGSMPQLVMNWLLASSTSDVDYVTNIQGSALVGAFASGEGDYVQVFEPVASSMERDGTGVVVASVGNLAEPFPYTTFASSRSWVESNSETADAFAQAIDAAIAMINEQDSADIAAMLTPYFPDSDEGLLAESVDRYRDGEIWASTPQLDQEQYERLLDIMISGEVLEEGSRVPYDAIVSSS